MYADWRFAISGGRSLREMIADEAWNREVFVPEVAGRGTAIIEARGASSAASAANAAIDHMRDWIHGTDGRWVSMGVPSDGSYGIPVGLVCGVPVTCEAGTFQRVHELPMDEFSQAMLGRTTGELADELQAVDTLSS